jgi:hypothetical protein
MNQAMAKRRTGEIGLYTGKTRSGKTYQLKKRVAREKRIIVWSVKESVDHYARDLGGTVIRTLKDLKQAVTQIGKGPGRLIYTPRSMADFGQWAVCAHAWGVFAPCSAIAEELADVTSAGKAPPGWGNLLRQGAGWGINIYGVTQRPAESDKTIIGNMSFIHAHQIMRAKDRAYVAAEMDLPVEQIAALSGYQWIERWQDGRIKRGK